MTLEEQLFARHAGKNILLDANLLLIFLAGIVDLHLFGRFKRVEKYTEEDFDLLEKIMRHFTVLLTTPHILAEVGNLANSLPADIKPCWYQVLVDLLLSEDRVPGVKEHWTPAVQLARTPEFSRFGIADSAVKDLAGEALIVTDDYRLSNSLNSQGIPCLNFRDLRQIQQQLL
jgi:hypothetical protein